MSIATPVASRREGVIRFMGSRAMEEARLLESLRHMTRIGNLADDVVRAALAIQRGHEPGHTESLSAARDLLVAAAAQMKAPLDVTSAQVDAETMGVLNAFNQFASSAPNHEPDETEAPSAQAAAHLLEVADVLARMHENRATPEEVEEVRRQFEAIARLTLTAANEAVKPKMNLSSWTPTLRS